MPSFSIAVPKVKKVVVSMKLGEARQDKGLVESLSADLAAITGQWPKICRAKKAIAGFKLQAGDQVGLAVTLRGKRMTVFLEKLFKIVLPRVRDFRGVKSSGFDGRGNYSLGLSEYLVFPEVDYDKVKQIRGLEITLVTTAKDDNQGRQLLEKLGMPFEKG